MSNKTTTLLKEAILLAAAAVGSNGKGKDGLVGYLMRAVIDFPQNYLGLLGKVLPLQLLGSIKVEDGKVYTTEEAEAILKDRGSQSERTSMNRCQRRSSPSTTSRTYLRQS